MGVKGTSAPRFNIWRATCYQGQRQTPSKQGRGARCIAKLWLDHLPGKENFKNRNGKRLVKAVTGSVRGMTANKYHLLMIYRFLGDVVLSLKELEQEQLTQYASRETVSLGFRSREHF